MDRSQVATLRGRLERLAIEGLVDIRFDLAGATDIETACGEVNALYAAVDAGRATPLDFKDSRR